MINEKNENPSQTKKMLDFQMSTTFSAQNFSLCR